MTGLRGHEYVRMKVKNASINVENKQKVVKFTFIGKGNKKGETFTYDKQ